MLFVNLHQLQRFRSQNRCAPFSVSQDDCQWLLTTPPVGPAMITDLCALMRPR